MVFSTIHAAKGLEWPVVYMPTVCDGYLPTRCLQSRGMQRGEVDEPPDHYQHSMHLQSTGARAALRAKLLQGVAKFLALASPPHRQVFQLVSLPAWFSLQMATAWARWRLTCRRKPACFMWRPPGPGTCSASPMCRARLLCAPAQTARWPAPCCCAAWCTGCETSPGHWTLGGSCQTMKGSGEAAGLGRQRLVKGVRGQ